MASIRISGLTDITSVTMDDFVPIDDSGSLTTYRASIQEISNLLAVSGSSSFASFANSASHAASSSNAVSASYSSTSSFLAYPNTATASFSQNGLSSSYAISASHANNSSNALSSSTSLLSISASHANFADSASQAISSSYTLSASFAQQSATSTTASFALTAATASYISSSALNFANQWVVLSERYTQGSNGPIVSPSFYNRKLNFSDYNSGSLVSLNTSSGVVTVLSPGLYKVRANGAVSTGPTYFQSKLNILVNSSSVLIGKSGQCGPNTSSPGPSALTFFSNIYDEVEGIISLNASDVLQLHHNFNIGGSVTFGVASSISASQEVYATLVMQKLS